MALLESACKQCRLTHGIWVELDRQDCPKAVSYNWHCALALFNEWSWQTVCSWNCNWASLQSKRQISCVDVEEMQVYLSKCQQSRWVRHTTRQVCLEMSNWPLLLLLSNNLISLLLNLQACSRLIAFCFLLTYKLWLVYVIWYLNFL